MLALLFLLTFASADLYMHNPRGSNNRLNEQSAERNNGDRLFDSQNNNRGGYNVGEKANTPFSPTQPYLPPQTVFDYSTPPVGGYPPSQYQFVFYEGSTLTVQWHNQHGCGGNEANDPYKLHCQIISQFMCETAPGGRAEPTLPMAVVDLQDGGNTNTPDTASSFAQISEVQTNNNNNNYGRHESEAFYYFCQSVQRNWWLFHADQNLGGSNAVFTRQNAGGNRNGLECPEERDYYPWWNPSPWIDIAYLTSNPEFCTEHIYPQTQNVNPVCYCDGLLSSLSINGNFPNTIPIDNVTCAASFGNWTCWNKNWIGVPDCQQVNWSRQNHLGNGRFGQLLSYNWTLPAFSDLVNYGHKVYSFASTSGATQNMAKCVFRLRYNMTTGDYDPFNTTSAQDDNEGEGIVSPIRQNPTVDIGAGSYGDIVGLTLTLNTNQYGRTFQDRSHVFYIAERPAAFAGAQIWNLNVRGKRGDIVEVYPSVVYDFVPNRFAIQAGSYIHVQWTGSNTHNNGNPAGDGQAGDSGLGKDGTDRHNFVQIRQLSDNYPLTLDQWQSNSSLIFNNVVCYTYDAVVLPWLDCSLVLATSGQLRSPADVAATTADMDPLLNDAPASLVGGVLFYLNPSASGKSFAYMSTRNNWFSHRSQKGLITVL